jgi:adenosylmethionine-8-amino-7-oxononanoate aminotransferase
MGNKIKRHLGTDLIEKDKTLLWHPFTPLIGSEDNLVIKRAEGARLFTHDGRVIIDAISSWWVNLHGHCNPHIAQAIAEQASVLEHVMFAGFSHEPAIELAENLLSILPDNQNKVFYSDNGSTSVEVALKMALQYWHNQAKDKTKIIALDGGYHGDTFGAMSVGARGDFTTPFWPFLFEVEFIELPGDDMESNQIEVFRDMINSGDVAAFIFEPIIQGAAGMRLYSASWLDQLISIAQSAGVLCIADEVMTGFGRTGRLFASEFLENKPDIFCLSKGLTGGAMALGATTCTKAVQDAYQHQDILKTFFHGHSFTANPIACAAANASFELLMSDACQAHIDRISSSFERFKHRIESKEKVVAVTHLGTILAIEFQSQGETSYVNEARHELYPYFMSKNVLLRPLGNIVYIIPPYVISDEELDMVYNAIVSYSESS